MHSRVDFGIDLPGIVRQWTTTNSWEDLGRPMFPALRLKLSDVNWLGGRQGPSKGATRSFEMKNESPASGTGHLQTVKDGRPVTTISITRGVIQGFPKLTTLRMPGAIHSVVGEEANIEMGQTNTHRVETSELKVDADVQLNRQDIKYAIVENTDLVYKDRFTAIATLSGKVLFEKGGEIRVHQIFSDMGVNSTWQVEGQLEVNFEDNQTLSLER